MPQKMTFRTGEFAKLVGVNKKTLHYYDEQGIFQPDSVKPNGYRYYSSRQLYSFYMIRSLREMGLSLAEIKAYLDARSPQGFLALLKEQEKWLQQEIHKYQRMKKLVRNQSRLLAMAAGLDCESVVEQELPAAQFIITQNVRGLREVEKERVVLEHMRYCMDRELNAGYAFGAMIAPVDCWTAQEDCVSFYFTQTDAKTRAAEAERRHLRPAGRYAVTYLRGDYMNTSAAYQRLKDYFSRHGWQPVGYAYEESVLEDMSAPSPEEYITRIILRIQK